MPLGFHHLCFFFLCIEAAVIITRISFDAWAIEEFVSMATGIRMEREYITKLLGEDEHHMQHKRQPGPHARLGS